MEADARDQHPDLTHPYTSAVWLVKQYITELERQGNLAKDAIVNRTPRYLKGEELILSVSDHLTLSGLYKALREKQSASSMIRAPHMEDNALYVVMALDRFQSGRCDYHTGSRQTRVLNNDPIDSINRPQSVKIIVSDELNDTEVSEDWKNNGCISDQHLVHWLRTFVRLSAGDVSLVMKVLDQEDYHSFLGRSDYMEHFADKIAGLGVADRKMLTVALRSMFDSRGGMFSDTYKHVDWKRLFSDPKELEAATKDIARKRDLRLRSYADQWAQGKWAALIHFKHGAECLKRLGSSFFLDISCEPWIHVVDTTVREREYCMLVFFSKEPNEDERTKVLAEVRVGLGIPEDSDGIVTSPFQQEPKDWHTDPTNWFRVDGCFKLSFKNRTLCEHLRELDAPPQDAEYEPGQMCHVNQHWIFNPDRRNVLFILLVRQSNGERDRPHDTIPSQMSAIILSLFIKQGAREKDAVHAEVETCSSSQHPLSDRIAWSRIRQKAKSKDENGQIRPVILITVNPDRATRRAEEVDEILDLVQSTGGSWFTQGYPQQCEEHELNFGETHWIEITRDNTQKLKDQLQTGRQRALYASYTANANNSMLRVTNALDRGALSVHRGAFQDALRLTMKVHGFDRMLLVSHSSTSAAKFENTSLSTTITTQSSFMKRMIPQDIAFEQYEEPKRSTYTSDFLNRLELQVKAHTSNGSRVLIMSTRLDRMIRNEELYPRFCEIVANGRHGVLSLFWDSQTNLDGWEALGLDRTHADDSAVKAMDKSIEEQRRAPVAEVSWPVVQPIMWVTPNGRPESETVAAHTARHVKEAEEWITAGFLTGWQGGTYVIPELKINKVHKPTLEEIRNWERVLSRAGDVFGQRFTLQGVVVNFSEGQSYNCSCEAAVNGGKPHSLDCQCRCSWCDRARYCPCATGKWGDEILHHHCECDIFCNCRCPCCHKQELGNAAAEPILGSKRGNEAAAICTWPECDQNATMRGLCKTHYDEERKSRPTCSEEGCENLAQASGMCGKHIKEAKQKQPCSICRKRIPSKRHGRICSQCRADNPSYQKKCIGAGTETSCTNDAFPGGTYGPRCEKHAKKFAAGAPARAAAKRKVREEMRRKAEQDRS